MPVNDAYKTRAYDALVRGHILFSIERLDCAPIVQIYGEILSRVRVMSLRNCQLIVPFQTPGLPASLLLRHPEVALYRLPLSVN